MAKATTCCESRTGQYSVSDLNGLRPLTQCWPFQLPQLLVTLSKLSKFNLLVSKNHIPLQFLNNTEIKIEKQRRGWCLPPFRPFS